jgi:hypothetical protein
MSASRALTVSASPSPEAADELARLSALGPEAQGDVDETLLLANLALTPLERLRAAGEAAGQVETLRRAVRATNLA